jgi:hypothetical protein
VLTLWQKSPFSPAEPVPGGGGSGRESLKCPFVNSGETGNPVISKTDDFVKSPSAALRFNPALLDNDVPL